MGKPDVRNFRGGAENRAMVDLYRHEAGNGGYRLREPKATAPVLYSTWGQGDVAACPAICKVLKHEQGGVQGAVPQNLQRFLHVHFHSTVQCIFKVTMTDGKPLPIIDAAYRLAIF